MTAIDGWGYAFLALVSIVLPLLAIETSRRLGGGSLPLPRTLFYLQTIVFQGIVLLIATVTAVTNRISIARLPREPMRGVVAAALLLAIALLVLLVRWPQRTAEVKRRLYELLPHDRSELPPYFALCVFAAVAEEVTYRGVAFALIGRLTSSTIAAALIAAAIFALGHMVQGWSSVGAIFLFAIGFQAIVYIAGSLLFAIVVHFAYDAIAGVLIPRLYSREL